jgi:hypothetical protein
MNESRKVKELKKRGKKRKKQRFEVREIFFNSFFFYYW